MNTEWIRTDDYQFISNMGDRMFDTINIVKHPNRGFLALHNEVHLNDLKDEELDNIVKSYGYKNYDDIKSEYGKDTDQIMAEIISETDFFESRLTDYDTKENINTWLKEISEELFIS